MSPLPPVTLLLLCLCFVMTFASPIDVAVDEKKHDSHVVDSVDLLIFVSLLTLTIVTLWTFKANKFRFVLMILEFFSYFQFRKFFKKY